MNKPLNSCDYLDFDTYKLDQLFDPDFHRDVDRFVHVVNGSGQKVVLLIVGIEQMF